MRKLILLILLACFQVSLAEKPVLGNDHYELTLAPGTKIVSRYDRGYETKMVVEQDGQRVRINWDRDKARVLFPTSTLRLQAEKVSKRMKTVIAYLDGKQYKVNYTPREVSWVLPDQEVYFRTRGGKIVQAAGKLDFLRLRRHTLAGRVTLESSVGTTDALLNSSGLLETFDGPEVTDHVYLVRGLAITQGPVTVRMKLPDGPFLSGLPKDRYFTISQNMEALPGPPDRTPKPKAQDPLQASPYTWSSPELRANSGEKSEDPLSVRKERRKTYPDDPLKAKSNEDEDVLRVKDY